MRSIRQPPRDVSLRMVGGFTKIGNVCVMHTNNTKMYSTYTIRVQTYIQVVGGPIKNDKKSV